MPAKKFKGPKIDVALAIRLAQEIYEETVGSKMLVNYAKDGAAVKRALLALDGDVSEFIRRWRTVITSEDNYLWSCDLTSFCAAHRFNKAGVLAAAETQRQHQIQQQQSRRDSWAASVARAKERRRHAQA